MPSSPKPKLLWANRYCLLDSSSGASMSVRQMLRQLAARGWDISVVGATVFDSENGKSEIGARLDALNDSDTQVVKVNDGSIAHHLVRTADHRSKAMTMTELNKVFSVYTQMLSNDRPDIVFFYGGNAFDLLIPGEAKRLGIPSAAYLANGNYKGTRWCEDVDVIISDSFATAQYYRDAWGLDLTPVGKFIPPAQVVAASHSRENLTFINPILEKGGAIVAQMALLMEKRRPDITFEVVESRGKWADVLGAVSESFGTRRTELSNVIVTPHTRDMRPIFGRSKVVFAPSLWWESGGRVIVEAMMNGIPAIVSNRGGPPEMMGEGGIRLNLPDELHEPPYKKILTSEAAEQMIGVLERMFDDDESYAAFARKAAEVGRTQHNMETNTDRLVAALNTAMGKDAA